VQYCEDVSYQQVGKVINGFIPRSDLRKDDVVVRPIHCKLPSDFIPIDEGGGKLADEAREYLSNRDFSIEVLSNGYGVGYVKKSGRYFRRIIFPFKDSVGKLVYFQARYAKKEHSYRWLNPKEHETPFGKSEVLYNEWNACVKTESIFVCEGIADVITMENAIGIQGKTLSIIQCRKLLGFSCSSYYFLFDEGAWRDSIHAAYILSQATDKPIYAIDMDKGDANEQGKDYVMKLSKEAIRITPNIYYEELGRVVKQGQKTYRGKVGGSVLLW